MDLEVCGSSRSKTQWYRYSFRSVEQATLEYSADSTNPNKAKCSKLASAVASERISPRNSFMFGYISQVLLVSFAAMACTGCNSKSVDPTVGTMPDRKLGFGVTEGSIGYELAFASARDAGMQFIELPQQWDEFEIRRGHTKASSPRWPIRSTRRLTPRSFFR